VDVTYLDYSSPLSSLEQDDNQHVWFSHGTPVCNGLICWYMEPMGKESRWFTNRTWFHL